MPKVDTWAGNALYALLLERCEEEGLTKSAVLKEALENHLGLTDPKPKRQPKVEYNNLVQKSLALPRKWWIELGIRSDEEGYPSMMAMIREWVRVQMDFPLPAPKPPRAKRDPGLSRDIIIEAQADMYNDMRNLRTSQEGKPREPELWEIIRANPDQIMRNPLFDCYVDGCKKHHMDWHRDHPNRDLGNLADKLEADWLKSHPPQG